MASKRNKTEHELYKVYVNMVNSTTKSWHKQFKINRRKGVTVCKRWDGHFNVFTSDMGKRPSENHYLKRYNNNVMYSPTNCYWYEANTVIRKASALYNGGINQSRQVSQNGMDEIPNLLG